MQHMPITRRTGAQPGRQRRDAVPWHIVKALSVLVGTATLALGLITAPSASATPTGCWHSDAGYQYARASCSGGTGGSYQVYAVCQQYVWPFMTSFNEGPWYPAGAGRISELRCPFPQHSTSVGVGLRR